ncbi:2'-5' RNA ligase family protein [Coleofasciculus sp. E1-EBD-02]|uniref:2'-5' RNA ligase family protein n=1 Tax=Coleofasciculus sp. E1-EBD-02 TaxID=3068481 RepID=UPI0032F56854
MLNMKKLFFIALLPPQTIQDSIMEIKQHCADVYESKAALKSPPHITLQSPFKWEVDAVPILEESLKSFAQTRKPVSITLQGFGAFKPRVIYVNVLKTPELIAIQQDLMAYLEDSLGIVDERSKNRSFSPHVTIAFRDLKRQNFRKAWTEFENQPLDFEFMASHLTLLLHDGRQWNVNVEFPFLTG